jgi:hypothetical protein
VRLAPGGTWLRPPWLRTLERSRSGQRLKILVDDLSVCENTTPIVGATSSSVVAPDSMHIREVLATWRPDVVIACGRQAELALLDIWSGPLLAIPHPAHRLVTNALYRQAAAPDRRIHQCAVSDQVKERSEN